MAVSGIGVQPVSPTTGTPAERKNPTPPPAERVARATVERAAPPPGTGRHIDKVA